MNVGYQEFIKIVLESDENNFISKPRRCSINNCIQHTNTIRIAPRFTMDHVPIWPFNQLLYLNLLKILGSRKFFDLVFSKHIFDVIKFLSL